jgi:asparagine synthase (glutamine-hydrolysing)
VSGFGIVITWDGHPTAAQVSAMADSIARRGPDGMNIVDRGECVLVHAQFATTPEAQRESQPLRHLTHDWWLTADARIDNRDELRTELTGHVTHPLDTDADFVMAAYEHWGADLARHLRGDFAFAIWNGETREAVVVRDQLGIRPLHWAAPTGGSFVAGSTLRGVLEAAQVPRTPDLEYLAEFATFELRSRGHSPFAEVHRLVPAHVLSAGPARPPSVQRYWAPPQKRRKVAIDTAVKDVKELFDAAVRERCRRVGPIGAQLSGGFDSSSVLLSAARQTGSSEVIALSLQFPGDPCDETQYAGAVAAAAGTRVEWLEALQNEPYDHVGRVAETLDLTTLTDNEWFNPMLRRASALGCRVVLTGQAGDHLLHGSISEGAIDLAIKGHFADAFHLLRGETAKPLSEWVGDLVWVARSGARMAAQRVAPGFLARLRRSLQGRRAPATLGPVLRQQALRGPADPVSARAFWRREASPYANKDALTWFAELWDNTAIDGPIEYRHPFLDSRLIEYVLSLPADFVVVGGHPRGLHRRALCTGMPPEVFHRTDKAEFSRPNDVALLRSSIAARRWEAAAGLGWIDDATITAALERTRARQTDPSVPPLLNRWALWGSLLVACWAEVAAK